EGDAPNLVFGTELERARSRGLDTLAVGVDLGAVGKAHCGGVDQCLGGWWHRASAGEHSVSDFDWPLIERLLLNTLASNAFDRARDTGPYPQLIVSGDDVGFSLVFLIIGDVTDDDF